MSATLSRRREFLFFYDIRMGNPNGDPDENRPRRLPDGTFYVTDVRLKRFVRDWLKTQGEAILVDRPEDAATNLTGRLQHFLAAKPEPVKEDCERYLNLARAASKPAGTGGGKTRKGKSTAGAGKPEGAVPSSEASPIKEGAGEEATEGVEGGKSAVEAGRLVVSIILKAFVDARLFGSSLAFKDWDIDPRPKTLTGAVQINMGEVIHRALEVDIAGTSTFASKEDNRQGTFTTYYGLRYGLIGFNGVANEHSARLSQLTDADYERFLGALWRCVSGAPTANTRSKMGQVPRLLIDIAYKPGSEFQFGCLLNYAKVLAEGKPESEIASPDDYVLDLGRLAERLDHPAVERVRYAVHPDMRHQPSEIPWEAWDLYGEAMAPRGS